MVWSVKCWSETFFFSISYIRYKSKIRLKWPSPCKLDDTAKRCWSGLMHSSLPPPAPLPSVHTKHFQTGRIRWAEKGHIHAIVCCTPVASITFVIFLFLCHQQPFPMTTQQQYLAKKMCEQQSKTTWKNNKPRTKFKYLTTQLRQRKICGLWRHFCRFAAQLTNSVFRGNSKELSVPVGFVGVLSKVLSSFISLMLWM